MDAAPCKPHTSKESNTLPHNLTRSANRGLGALVAAAAILTAGCANELLSGQAAMREQLTTLYQDQILQSLAAMKAGSMPLMIAHSEISQSIESTAGAELTVGDNDTINSEATGDDNVFVEVGSSDSDELGFKLSAGLKGNASFKTRVMADPKLYQRMREFALAHVNEGESDTALHNITLAGSKPQRTFHIADGQAQRHELGVIFESFITGKDPAKEPKPFALTHNMTAIAAETVPSDGYTILKIRVAPPMPEFSNGICRFDQYEADLLAVEATPDIGRNIVYIGIPTEKVDQADRATLHDRLLSSRALAASYNTKPKPDQKTDRWDHMAEALVNLPKAIEKLRP